MNASQLAQRHQAAPDRPRDLHPLQHLRGDLPGRGDHARLAQLRGRCRASATSAWPASRRARPARSTTGARCRASRPTRWTSSCGWDELPAELSAGAAGRGAACAADAAPAPSPRRRRCRPPPAARPPSTAPQYGATLPPWSAAHAYTNLYGPKAAEKRSPPPWSATCASPRSAREYDTHHIVLDFGAMPFPVLEGQSIGILPPGVDANGRAAPRAPVLDRQPAQRRAAGLQQPVADDQARARGPPGQAGARRGSATTCAT